MTLLERMLVAIDSRPWNAVWRFGLGLSMPPVFHALAGQNAPIWTPLICFLFILLLLHVVSALLRRALPFSAEAKTIWSERRKTARQNDSYQWQKLLWIGFGLTADFLVGTLTKGEILLALICLIGGSAGLFFWQKSRPVVPATHMTRVHP